MLPISEIISQLETPKSIFITCHQKPDADAIGSTLGLYHYLKMKGHDATVVSPNEIPDFLDWMPGKDTILNFEAESKVCLEVLEKADLIFCLDFNHLSRTKLLEEPLRNATQKRILIDHHLEPEPLVFYAGTSDSEKSSTCEMIFDFIKQCGDEAMINTDIATCLYTGAMTDTGSFRFPSTGAGVHEMIAFFKKAGLKHAPIHEAIYDAWSVARMRFIGFALYQKMELILDNQVSIIALSEEEMKPFNLSSGDTEGLVNQPLGITSVKVSVLLTEKNGLIKLSFRSKGQIDVSSFSRANFNGGGHFNAAGGASTDSMEDTVNKIKTLISSIIP